MHTEAAFEEKLKDPTKDLNDETKECLKGKIEDKEKWAQTFDT